MHSQWALTSDTCNLHTPVHEQPRGDWRADRDKADCLQVRNEMRIYPLRIGIFLACACFLSVSWIKSIGSYEDSRMPDLHLLYNRLSVAEELGVQVRNDLSIILEHLVNKSKAANASFSYVNATETVPQGETLKQLKIQLNHQTFYLPNIYQYLPHLREHADSLVPNVLLGQGRRGVSLVLGIPTVKREKQSYLVNTLSSLLFSLTASEKEDLLIIVFVAETDSDYVKSVAKSINDNFSKEVESGLVEVVSPSQHYYPDFNTIKETFGDSKDRVKWRAKQNLDFSFLMLYAQDKGVYYVQLEDDVVAKDGYYSDMKTYTTREASKDWLFLEFSQLGFIGKLFRTRDLPMIAEFFLMFHRDKPVDWLLDHILWVKACHPEKDKKDCETRKALLKQRFKPSLFQHVGLHSSLPGKIQNLKDKDFMKQSLFKAHLNPPAELTSSLKHYKQHSLNRLYEGQDFLWALTPIKGDFICFNFTKPIHVSGYLFRSGNIETSTDKFYNTTVEVQPANGLTKQRMASKYKNSDNGFFTIGAFINGVAEGEIDEELQPVSALRLVFQSDSDLWAVLSEVHIKV
ncbi:alpha-1,3-mannosyl-glycoprotein 4-beta-N-acetylglucosaminyltransferase A isoform X2 [Oryzias melastigma]|uniref:alpha-1,3-mannosyl-glycoprotein 4-beta-N-acetylglucosaminyltransferase A isoform X2 n=1 Tax=Oryzias melastigma TaxID=30732 RepID=UPI000CF80942|nr:alpha-1,3-mannosyl-glycoprotein 4-beta-N-acetylglucosaminyltransferase A isoform X2 [Oryzias melastigma]